MLIDPVSMFCLPLLPLPLFPFPFDLEELPVDLEEAFDVPFDFEEPEEPIVPSESTSDKRLVPLPLEVELPLAPFPFNFDFPVFVNPFRAALYAAASDSAESPPHRLGSIIGLLATLVEDRDFFEPDFEDC